MQGYRNLKIRTKLVSAFAIIIFLLAIVGVMGVVGVSKINTDLEKALTIDLPALDYLIESDRDLQQLLVAERSMIFANASSEDFQQLVADYGENLKQAQDRLDKYEALPLSDEEKAILERYKKDRAAWVALSTQIVDGRKADTREGRRLAIDLSLNQARLAFEKMRDHLNKLQELSLTKAENARQDAKKIYNTTFLSVVILTAAAILVVLILLSLLRKTVIQPIQNMVSRGRDLSEGQADLTKRLHLTGKDELAEFAMHFDKFLNRLQEIMIRVKKSSSEMLDSTDQISSGSQELATRTNQQAASITQTSTALEEFTAILKQNSDQSQEANARITSFDHEIQDKRELIRNVTGTMSEIDRSSKKIDNIMNVINDISFQTNLLALNAAVEAARAGEAGRGFAVVASEVRNLAQKTAESSKTIQEIVTTNVNSTERGMELVKETETFFESIMNILGELSNVMASIENGSREQSTGMDQINQAVMQLEQVINQNAELVGEFAATGNSIHSNARDTFKLVEQFITERSSQESTPESGKIDQTNKRKKEKNESEAMAPRASSSTVSGDKPGEASDFFSADDSDFEEF